MIRAILLAAGQSKRLKGENKLVRKLTVRECYRIMGFPENFILNQKIGEQYKQIGNSVGTTVVSELARQILDQGMLTEDEAQKEIKRDSSKVVNKQTQLAL